MKLNIKEKLKGALSGTFNVLSGKKGWRATVNGYGAVASVGALGVAAGLLAVGSAGIVMLPVAAIALGSALGNAGNAHRAVKHQNKKNGPA